MFSSFFVVAENSVASHLFFASASMSDWDSMRCLLVNFDLLCALQMFIRES